MGQMARNVTVGTITGVLYKSTLGLRPMVVGGIVGASFITGLTYGINGLNDLGIVGFRADV